MEDPVLDLDALTMMSILITVRPTRWRGHVAGRREEWQATILVDSRNEAGVESFHDDEQAYLHVPVETASRNLCARSKSGRAWLQNLFIDAVNECPGRAGDCGRDERLEALTLAGPITCGSCPHRDDDRGNLYDLGDPFWRHARVTPQVGKS